MVMVVRKLGLWTTRKVYVIWIIFYKNECLGFFNEKHLNNFVTFNLN